MRSQPYSGREKIGVANGGREKWNKGPFLVFRALLLWAYAHAMRRFYRVPPFVCIPHIMTPLASLHARTKSARPPNKRVCARDFLIFYFGPFLVFRALVLWPYALPPYRFSSSAPFCVHSPQYDTTRIFARAQQVRAPLKIKGYVPAMF